MNYYEKSKTNLIEVKNHFHAENAMYWLTRQDDHVSPNSPLCFVSDSKVLSYFDKFIQFFRGKQ